MEHTMKTQIKTTLTTLFFTLAAITLIGCESAPRNQGAAKSYRLESRLPGDGPNLGSADLVNASDKMTTVIANRLAELKQLQANKIVIVMDQVENKTSDPSARLDIFLARIRVQLNKSGARKNMIFVETRRQAEAVKQREGIPPADSKRTRPEYALKAIFYDLPRGRTNYHLLTFQLMDLRDDTLVVEDQYEVKL